MNITIAGDDLVAIIFIVMSFKTFIAVIRS